MRDMSLHLARLGMVIDHLARQNFQAWHTCITDMTIKRSLKRVLYQNITTININDYKSIVPVNIVVLSERVYVRFSSETVRNKLFCA